VDHPWLVVSLSVLFKSCISFHIRLVYDVEKERSSQELLGVNIREAQENQLSFILKQRQASVHITPFRDFTL
jgi:hypothetical protein